MRFIKVSEICAGDTIIMQGSSSSNEFTIRSSIQDLHDKTNNTYIFLVKDTIESEDMNGNPKVCLVGTITSFSHTTEVVKMDCLSKYANEVVVLVKRDGQFIDTIYAPIKVF